MVGEGVGSQGTHWTGNTGKTWKMAKEIHCQGKHRENTGNLVC